MYIYIYIIYTYLWWITTTWLWPGRLNQKNTGSFKVPPVKPGKTPGKKRELTHLFQVSNKQDPSCLGYVGDCTTPVYRDCKNSYQTTSIQWKARVFFRGSSVSFKRLVLCVNLKPLTHPWWCISLHLSQRPGDENAHRSVSWQWYGSHQAPRSKAYGPYG